MAVDLRAVLELSGALQRSSTYADLLLAARGAVMRTTRFKATWLIAVEETPEGPWCRILAMQGDTAELVWERAPRFPVGADPFLREILEGDHPVVVEDMRTDPRTDKEIVSRTDHRTSVCVPMRIGDATLGILCVGTFGVEGVISPTADEVEHLTVFATLVAAAFDWVRVVQQRDALDAEARALADKSRVLEEQLRHLQRLESAGQLASGIAHDFNNLLTAIAGHAELSLGEGPPAPVAESLGIILEATQRGSHLTRNLLSFSRRRVLSRRVADLNPLVERVRQLVLPAIRPDITLRFTPADGPVPAFVDEVELEHAVLNLVTNARDAIPDAGEIRLAVRVVDVDDDFVARHAGRLVGACARVTVEDNGVGIPEDTLTKVFEPFFTTKGVGRGTGLGLAMVRALVDQHGGVVEVASEVGRGTTFALFLPLTAAAPTSTAGTGTARGAREGATILVAEDDDVVRALLVRVLRGQGYQVLEASDGQAAIELFRAESARVDAVLTDLMMPRRSGLELVDAVLAFQQNTPIVVMSGYTSDPAGAARLSDLGLPVIRKPTTPTEVLAHLRRALARGAPPAVGGGDGGVAAR